MFVYICCSAKIAFECRVTTARRSATDGVVLPEDVAELEGPVQGAELAEGPEDVSRLSGLVHGGEELGEEPHVAEVPEVAAVALGEQVVAVGGEGAGPQAVAEVEGTGVDVGTHEESWVMRSWITLWAEGLVMWRMRL